MLLSEGGDDQQRHSKAVHILLAGAVRVSKASVADGREGIHVVVPATPVVPHNQDDSVAPEAAVVSWRSRSSDCVNDVRNVVGSQPNVFRGMVRPSAVGNHPGYLCQITILEVLQKRRQIVLCLDVRLHIVVPVVVRTSSRPAASISALHAVVADVVDGVGGRPDGPVLIAVVSPSDLGLILIEQVGERRMLEARIYRSGFILRWRNEWNQLALDCGTSGIVRWVDVV